jgi:2-polyprenyl-3-methyl-5-hydroxy-6-metoxy-1,4-benzoquinol methylase
MERRIVHKVEPDTDRQDILCTTYQMRNFYRQFADGYFTNLDVMNYIQHLKAVQMMRSGDQVLDVACGRSLLLPLIRYRRKGIAGYTGVDISKANIKEAMTHSGIKTGIDPATYYPFPTHWLRANVAQMSRHLPHDHFDLAVFTSSLEHMHPDAGEQSLRECGTVLKAGGLLFLSTPNTLPGKDGYNTRYAAHVFEWSLPQLRTALASAGFVVEHEYGLVIGKRELLNAVKALGPQVRLVLEPLFGYLPNEFLTAVLAAPFPTISKEVLVIARKESAR